MKKIFEKEIDKVLLENISRTEEEREKELMLQKDRRESILVELLKDNKTMRMRPRGDCGRRP